MTQSDCVRIWACWAKNYVSTKIGVIKKVINIKCNLFEMQGNSEFSFTFFLYFSSNSRGLRGRAARELDMFGRRRRLFWVWVSSFSFFCFQILFSVIFRIYHQKKVSAVCHLLIAVHPEVSWSPRKKYNKQHHERCKLDQLWWNCCLTATWAWKGSNKFHWVHSSPINK